MSRATKVLDVTVKTMQMKQTVGSRGTAHSGRSDGQVSHRCVYTESQVQGFLGLRRLSRKLEEAKREAKMEGKIPKGVKLPVSNNRRQDAAALARLHARIANIRSDFTHKLTTRLVSENQAIGIEDLSVQGMVKNHRLALALSDVGFGEIRRQLQYKSVLYGTTVVTAGCVLLRTFWIAEQWNKKEKLSRILHDRVRGPEFRWAEFTRQECFFSSREAPAEPSRRIRRCRPAVRRRMRSCRRPCAASANRERPVRGQ